MIATMTSNSVSVNLEGRAATSGGTTVAFGAA
jgi:hypothetical protein